MHRLRAFFRNFFDIRQGEYLRTTFMAGYLLFVLFAYYILKPVARSLFLNRFEIDDVPYLHILIAGAGGLLAYGYSKLAIKTSLRTAVTWAMALSVLCLVVMWYLLGLKDAEGHPRLSWMLYVLNVWTSLFAVVLVSQGWLVAANVFNGREAKRVYALLGIGAVVGAAFGGEFTRRTVMIVGTTNLLPASAFMVVLAYLSFRMVLAQRGVAISQARAAGEQETEFSFSDILGGIRRTPHLQMIIAIIGITFIVDVLVEYQFFAMAKERYSGNELTAFFGSFYGLYLNAATFLAQLFLTNAVISRFGVGGTLQIMPIAITAASVATIAAPGIFSTGAARLTEAVSRYTLNRTGMELLYLPLPADLRNRTKAFVDIFADRFSRGLGGVLLLLLTSVLNLGIRQLAGVVMVLAAVWIALSLRASREYVATVRKRLESRRLDLESVRIRVSDPATVRMLEETAAGDNPRQATYAVTLLGETQGYALEPLLRRLAGSPHPELRAKIYELALAERMPGLVEEARQEVERAGESPKAPTLKPAAAYLVALSPDAAGRTPALLEHENQLIAQGALESLCANRPLANQVIDAEWLERAASSEDWRWRTRAAAAMGLLGDVSPERLHRLFEDPDRRVVASAIQGAGCLRDRSHLHALVRRLADPHLRGPAVQALALYGPSITGSLSDILEDSSMPAVVRRQIPRVLKRIAHQRSVDVLLNAAGHEDMAIRAAVLKALNRLRQTAPHLKYSKKAITEHILDEAKQYFRLAAALAPFRNGGGARRATDLLRRTLEERLKLTLERMFRLLGLSYPPKEIYSAYLALHRGQTDEFTAAIELLDHVLERDLKQVLLPLLDAPEHILERGPELFDLDPPRDIESALRELIAGGDPWLSACAIAAAAELNLRSLAPDIAEKAALAERDVYQVAISAQEALARG